MDKENKEDNQLETLDDQGSREDEATHDASNIPEERESDDREEESNFDFLNWDGFEIVDELDELDIPGETLAECPTSEDETSKCRSSEEERESESRYSRFKSHREGTEGKRHGRDGASSKPKDYKRNVGFQVDYTSKKGSFINQYNTGKKKRRQTLHEGRASTSFQRGNFKEPPIYKLFEPGFISQDFPPPPTRGSAAIKKVTCSSNWKLFSRVIILNDSRIKMKVSDMVGMAPGKIQVYSKSHLTLDDLVSFTEKNVDLSSKVTTLLICCVGTYDILKFENAKVCEKVPDHEAIKEVSLKNTDVNVVVKELLQKMKEQKKKLNQLLGPESEVYFSSIVPINLRMFHEYQLKQHKKGTEHELDFKYSVKDLKDMQDVLEQILMSLNKIVTRNNLSTLPLNLWCYPRRLARSQTKFYDNSKDGIKFSERFCTELTKDLSFHISKLFKEQSKYEKVVFVGDSRFEHIRKAWPVDLRYNCKIVTDPELSLHQLSNATDPIMKEICSCKNSLIVLSLGIHDLCKLVSHDECDSHEKLKVFMPLAMDSVSKVEEHKRLAYERSKLLVNIWRILGNVKRLTENCDVYFLPMYNFDLISYQDYVTSLHQKKFGHTIQTPVLSEGKEFSKGFDDIVSLVQLYNMICQRVYQLYPRMIINDLLLGIPEIVKSWKMRKVPSSVLIDGIHPAPSFAKDMAGRFQNFADQALKIGYWYADKFQSPLKQDFYDILLHCRFKTSRLDHSRTMDIYNVRYSEDRCTEKSFDDGHHRSDRKGNLRRSTEHLDSSDKNGRPLDSGRKVIDSSLLESLSDVSGSDNDCISTRELEEADSRADVMGLLSGRSSSRTEDKYKTLREESPDRFRVHDRSSFKSSKGSAGHSFSGGYGSRSRSRSPVPFPERAVCYPSHEAYLGLRTSSEKRAYSRELSGGSVRRSRSNSRSPFSDRYLFSSSSRVPSNRRSRSRSFSRSPSVEKKYGERSRLESSQRESESDALRSLLAVHKRECQAYHKHPNAHPDYEKEFKKYRDKKMQCIIDLGGDPSSYDITKDWDKFWSTRMSELLEKSWFMKRNECLDMLRQPKSKVTPSASKREKVHSKLPKLKKKRSRSKSYSQEREGEHSYREKDIKKGRDHLRFKRTDSVDSLSTSSDEDSSSQSEGHTENSSDNDENIRSKKAYLKKNLPLNEEALRDTFMTHRKGKEKEEDSATSRLNSSKVDEEILDKYKQMGLKLPALLREQSVANFDASEFKFLVNLREKEKTNLTKVKEDSFIRETVVEAKKTSDHFLDSMKDKDISQHKLTANPIEEVKSMLLPGVLPKTTDHKPDTNTHSIMEDSLFNTAVLGKYSLPSSSKRDPADKYSLSSSSQRDPADKYSLPSSSKRDPADKYSLSSSSKRDPADEVASKPASIEAGKKDDLFEVLEILTRLGDRLNMLKNPLKVVYEKALQYQSTGIDSNKLLDEKDAKTLLHLISSKLGKLIEDDALNVIQKVIIKESNESLKNILKASGPGLDTNLIAEKCLGKNEADTIAYIRSQFLEGGSYEVSHEQLQEIYAAVKVEKSKLLTQILKKTNITSTEGLTKASPVSSVKEKDVPYVPNVNSPWLSEDSQGDKPYSSHSFELKLNFPAREKNQDSPSGNLPKEFPQRHIFEDFLPGRGTESSSKNQSGSLSSKPQNEEINFKKNSDDNMSRYESDHVSKNLDDNKSRYESDHVFKNLDDNKSRYESDHVFKNLDDNKSRYESDHVSKKTENFSSRRPLEDFILARNVESAPDKKKLEERKSEDLTWKRLMESIPGQNIFESNQSKRESNDQSIKRKNEEPSPNFPSKRSLEEFQSQKVSTELTLQSGKHDTSSEKQFDFFTSEIYSSTFSKRDVSSPMNFQTKLEYPSTSAVSSSYSYPSSSASSTVTGANKGMDPLSLLAFFAKGSEGTGRSLPGTTGYSSSIPPTSKMSDMHSFGSDHSQSSYDSNPSTQVREKAPQDHGSSSLPKNPIRLVIPKHHRQGSNYNHLKQSMDDSSW